MAHHKEPKRSAVELEREVQLFRSVLEGVAGAGAVLRDFLEECGIPTSGTYASVGDSIECSQCQHVQYAVRLPVPAVGRPPKRPLYGSSETGLEKCDEHPTACAQCGGHGLMLRRGNGMLYGWQAQRPRTAYQKRHGRTRTKKLCGMCGARMFNNRFGGVTCMTENCAPLPQLWGNA